MEVPERYKDIRDYFEGLQVAGELSDEFKISIEKHKWRESTQFTARTHLGEGIPDYIWSEKNILFKKENIGKQSFYYFPFTVAMSRRKDEVIINAYLPAASVDNEGERLFINIKQLEKMYKNGIVYDMRVNGFRDVSINGNSRNNGFELKAILGAHHNHQDVAKIYEMTKARTVAAFNSIKR